MARPLRSPSFCIAAGILLIAVTVVLNQFGLLAFLPQTPLGIGVMLILLAARAIVTRTPMPLSEMAKIPVNPPESPATRTPDSN